MWLRILVTTSCLIANSPAVARRRTSRLLRHASELPDTWQNVLLILLAGLIVYLLLSSIFQIVRDRRNPIPDPTRCPLCGSRMTRRTARWGRYKGRDFWGCTRFPQCRGTRPIEINNASASADDHSASRRLHLSRHGEAMPKRKRPPPLWADLGRAFWYYFRWRLAAVAFAVAVGTLIVVAKIITG